MKKEILILFLAACSAFSCERRKRENQRAEMEDSIRLTLEYFSQAVNENRIDEQLSFYDDSSAFYWIPAGSEKCLSRDSFITFLRSSTGKKELHWMHVDIEPVNDKLASYKAKFKLKEPQTDST